MDGVGGLVTRSASPRTTRDGDVEVEEVDMSDDNESLEITGVGQPAWPAEVGNAHPLPVDVIATRPEAQTIVGPSPVAPVVNRTYIGVTPSPIPSLSRQRALRQEAPSLLSSHSLRVSFRRTGGARSYPSFSAALTSRSGQLSPSAITRTFASPPTST